MKIQCNACQVAEAYVLCCADEAALCWECDKNIHAANKLAGKHQRVPLTSSHLPNCDICQEIIGYFFCLEDRALLCRKCDVAIHTANPFVSAHQRYLLTGVKVGLEATKPSAPSTNKNLDSVRKASEPAMSRAAATPSIASLTGGAASRPNVPLWLSQEYLGLTDLNQNYGFLDGVSSSKFYGRYCV